MREKIVKVWKAAKKTFDPRSTSISRIVPVDYQGEFKSLADAAGNAVFATLTAADLKRPGKIATLEIGNDDDAITIVISKKARSRR